MSQAKAATARRRWLAPEVVQTSSMDCGPAALKCLLEGFHIPVSYGRLREACQTDVDGTSIDTIEIVANQLGLFASQEMLPLDHLFLKGSEILPALIVVRHADGPTHFVVVWRRLGDWLQVMDPAIGRRWVKIKSFLDEIFRHETSVQASDWREWASTDEFLTPLHARLRELGASKSDITSFVSKAEADESWLTFGALDASIRLAKTLVEAGGLAAGNEATKLLSTLFAGTCAHTQNSFRFVPAEYWSVRPDPVAAGDGDPHVMLRGAVLVRVSGRGMGPSQRGEAGEGERSPLSPELAAALSETAPNPLRLLWGMLKADGILAPAALVGAIAIASGGAVIEALLFRGLFDIGGLLNLPSQRLLAALGLLAFAVVLLAIRIPIVAESLRIGRRFDALLRMALLRKLPHLTDRYFQSRPISDMADRSHSIHLTRNVPGIGIHFVQSLFELLLTLVGIVIIAPASIMPALLLTGFALLVPAIAQPLVNERDLRVRNHAGALSGFYLDTLLGLVPVRTHRAERAVRHQHESLLVEWARSSRRLVRASILANAVQSVGAVGLASYLLVTHFMSIRGVTGADLLLIFWTLKLPAIGSSLTGLAHQYPMQRNVLLRLLEPLSAPETPPRNPLTVAEGGQQSAAASDGTGLELSHGVSIAIEGGGVLAAGRSILHDVDLKIAPGEHVAIVGLSGAGKSSLIGLLLGWHRLSEGRIDIDGAELTPDRLAALRHEVAWLDPAIHVWNKSFLSNLNYSSNDPDFGRTADAIDAAHLRGVLKKLPLGLQSNLGEGGALLSGGEGQRVRLGRTLVQSRVRLALLDEPFRGIDREQRSAMLAEARERWSDITLLCVTHDVSETESFDRVLVIEDGRIIEDGAPSRLREEATRYRDLLETERQVRLEMWAGAHWRHIRMQDGAVTQGAE